MNTPELEPMGNGEIHGEVCGRELPPSENLPFDKDHDYGGLTTCLTLRRCLGPSINA